MFFCLLALLSSYWAYFSLMCLGTDPQCDPSMPSLVFSCKARGMGQSSQLELERKILDGRVNRNESYREMESEK